MTEIEYRQLKAKIDQEAQAQTAKIEEERVQNHQALNRVWAMIRGTASNVTKPQETLFTPVSISTNGGTEGATEKAPFAMKEAIRNFVRERGNGDVSQPLVYKHLVAHHNASISHRDQQQVRGQITGVLSKMTKGAEPELKFLRKDSQGTNIYRSTGKLADYKPVIQSFPTEVRK